MPDFHCYQTSSPTCPGCGHEMTDDEMHDYPVDLYAIAPDEGDAEIECPSCGVTYYCQGSYRPQYTSTLERDDS